MTVELESANTAVATYLLRVKRVSVANSFQYRFNVTLLPSKITLTVLNVIVDGEDLFTRKVQCSLWVEAAQIRGEGKFK